MTLMTRLEENRWHPAQQNNPIIPAVYARFLSECMTLREIRSIPLWTGIMLRSIQSLMNSTTQRAQAKGVNHGTGIVLVHYPKLNRAHH
jgi:hypothetical protein